MKRKTTSKPLPSTALLTLQDPSGEIRSIPLTSENRSHFTLGRTPEATFVLRDPTLPPVAAEIWVSSRQSDPPGDSQPRYWIRALHPELYLKIADIPAREVEIQSGIPIYLGESKVTLSTQTNSSNIIPSPKGVRPWKTLSPSGTELLTLTHKAASTPLSIYLSGETGTGKEVLAHLIHSWSPRANGPFIPLHCGALPLSLAESELFGHVKGAFTGAVTHRPGALMQAHGGTLFLDEVGDLPLDIQVKLLRFLENGEIRPVGADQCSRADVRIVCATHHSLQKLVDEGKFRRDLYYRIASITLQIPKLSTRPDDIALLAREFASSLNKFLSPAAILKLQSYDWPGNVRELRHAVERACGIAGPFVQILDQSSFDFLNEATGPQIQPTTSSLQNAHQTTLPASLRLDEVERVLLLKALSISHGRRADAAEILGVARSTLFQMIKRHRIVGPKEITFN